jgi:hypothetical protein
MTTPALDPIEVFFPGRHQPAQGEPVTFTEADLRRAAEVYDPALHRAPLVVGHPQTDDPAYGHVDRLVYDEQAAGGAGRLVARPAEVEDAFCELVRSGRLLAVSAAWYTPTSPVNPVPGAWYLRHVGFLGAQPPALKGLKRPTVKFSDAEEGVVVFGDWADEQNAGLWQRMREWLIGKFGLAEADQAVPSYLVDTLKREALQPATEPAAKPASIYSEPGAPVTQQTTAPNPADAARAAELDRREAEIKAREDALALGKRQAEYGEFADGLVKAGRLLPAHRAGVVAVLASLVKEQVVEFTEGDKPVQRPAVEVLKEFLAALPVQVDFSERARDDARAGKPAGEVDTTDGRAIAKAALAFQEAEAKAGRQVSLDAAVQHIVDTHKEA